MTHIVVKEKSPLQWHNTVDDDDDDDDDDNDNNDDDHADDDVHLCSAVTPCYGNMLDALGKMEKIIITERKQDYYKMIKPAKCFQTHRQGHVPKKGLPL